jgi:protein-disulfide isomerase
MQRKSLISILAVAGGALVLVIALIIAMKTTSNKKSVDTSNLNMVSSINEMLSGIPQQGTAIGNPKAKVTMVEFADPQCSACAQFSEEGLPELFQNYVRTGKLRIVYQGQTFVDTMVKPNVNDSDRLLRAALAAGKQSKLWNIIEIVYANQGGEDTGYPTDSYLSSVATAAGVDPSIALDAQSDQSLAAPIKASAKLFAASGFSSTPSLLLGRTGQKPSVKLVASKHYFPTYEDLGRRIDALVRG